jgi:hypothetical protein
VIPLAARRVWYWLVPVDLQMWVHRKADHDWRPSRLVAQALPPSVVYWTVIRAGVETIHGDEIVPEVRFTEVLQRVQRERT